MAPDLSDWCGHAYVAPQGPRSHTPRSTKVEPRVHGSPAQYTQLRVADCQMMSVSIVDHDEGQDLRSKVEVGSERSANVEVG